MQTERVEWKLYTIVKLSKKKNNLRFVLPKLLAKMCQKWEMGLFIKHKQRYIFKYSAL